MTDLQVLLDARGATDQDLRASVSTLLRQVSTVEIVHADETRLADLMDRFGSRVGPAERVRANVPVLVASARVCFAAGAVRRILADLSTTGRALTRVLLEDLPAAQGQIACWAPQWLAGYGGSLGDLVAADLDFDREHLSHESPVIRSWISADAVGVALAATVGEDPERWARRTGRVRGREELIAAVRAPAGVARRRLGRRMQRRRSAAR